MQEFSSAAFISKIHWSRTLVLANRERPSSWLILHHITPAAGGQSEFWAASQHLLKAPSLNSVSDWTLLNSLCFGRVPETSRLMSQGNMDARSEAAFSLLSEWCVCLFMGIFSFRRRFIDLMRTAIFWHQHAFSLKPASAVVAGAHWAHSLVQWNLRAARREHLKFYFRELLSKWCYYMKVEFWRVLRSVRGVMATLPPVHCRLRSFMMECWKTRPNDEWWAWVNCMSEKYRYVSQTFLLSMSDTGRLPTHTHTHTLGLSVWYTGNPSHAASAKVLLQ